MKFQFHSAVILSGAACLLLLISGSLRAEQGRRELQFNFLGEQFDNEQLVPLGMGVVRLMEPRRDGLFFNLPAGHKISVLGISPRFQISGDFEITATYEVPAWKNPQSGYGLGPSVYLRMHDENESAAMIGRLLRPGNKHVFSTTLSTTVEGKRNYDVKLVDAKQNSGKLKLIRTGKQLKFLISDGTEDEFRELREVELGTADVDLLRLGAQQSDAETPVQVLWKDLSITAESFPNHPDSLAVGERQHIPTYQAAPQPQSISLIWSLVAGIALLCILLAVYVVRKRA
ncbi:DUF1583 domain-containing protein [Gimesia sp.]|mgnify:CR=1 FL=1|uniref:DUF1583 domain-containing protein n=1 Tax=Gimesia sp. TaxID=2024833 RepID=UPI000C4641AB|nr:DUF1583 domain-containing protein [Gimesia sp.]MAX40256.1 hypothetical protein [Gimesia sp.]HAH48630.1 hypothetical protein [Planctomycetaceae bacterium]HBL46495.1 hypothetical protein [Planctomycetaceae bacterium]|tara:strand:+ start:52621 stop:53481 length:861 start_codon:yes stop_codon:yes gene_type:complete